MAQKKKKKIIKKKPVRENFSSRKIKIRVVGLGGGGTSIVSEMNQSLKGVSFVVADTDNRVFKVVKNRRGIKVLQFGQKLIGGMGTGMNAELAQKAAFEEKEKIKGLFRDQDISILVGSLGGGVASGAGPVFASLAKDPRTVSLGIFTLPFQFEGEKRMRLAKKSLEKLKESLSAVIVVPNERIFEIVDKKTPLKKSLSALNQMFAKLVRDLIEIISKPSLINIDFADLKTILKGQGEMLFFGQAAGQGPSRAEEVIKKMLHNPLLEGGPKNVKRILFNITGGKDLAIKEVQSISQHIASLNEKAKIIFGLSQSPIYNGRIKVALLALTSPPSNSLNKTEHKKTKPKKGVKTKQAVLSKGQEGHKNEAVKKMRTPPAKQRRSALEAKKAEKEKEEKEWLDDKEWDTPAFLREDAR